VDAGRLVRRLLVVLLVAAFAVVCLRLGWWQWQRYRSASGSAQNLGYMLQWPTFALFAIFMWWRLSKLEAKRRQDAQPEPAVVDPKPPPPARSANPAPSDEPDDELAAYNRYLAQLHAKESDRAS
jgi:DNA-binding transcriptional regulator of glucitol operon